MTVVERRLISKLSLGNEQQINYTFWCLYTTPVWIACKQNQIFGGLEVLKTWNRLGCKIRVSLKSWLICSHTCVEEGRHFVWWKLVKGAVRFSIYYTRNVPHTQNLVASLNASFVWTTGTTRETPITHAWWWETSVEVCRHWCSINWGQDYLTAIWGSNIPKMRWVILSE